QHERRVDILDLNPVEHQDHAALAHRLERHLDLALQIERATPFTAWPIEGALRIGRHDRPDEARRLVHAVMALDPHPHTAAHALARTHCAHRKRELRSLDRADARYLVERFYHHGHGRPAPDLILSRDSQKP